MSRVRLTAHNGRRSKNGVFSRRHNDRQFDLEKAVHIDPARMSGNIYWYFGRKNIGGCESIYEHELKFYVEHFGADLSKRNENPIKNRQYSRVKTMEQYISSPNTCPEETIFQIGRQSDEGKADSATLANVFQDFVKWHKKKYPQANFLDAALHVDEPDCAPHIHFRKVWIAHKDGIEIVNQTKALEEMGIERMFPDMPKGRYNNSKITYTVDCREKLIEIGKSYGIDIEEMPKRTSVTGLNKLDNDAQEAEKRRDKAIAEEAAIRKTIANLTENVINTIVPEKVGFFQRKTGNMVIPTEIYEWVVNTGQYFNTAAENMLKNAKATEEDRAIAAEERAKAEQSAYRQQLAIRAAAEKLLKENHEEELRAKEEAEHERDELRKLKKHNRQIIKKEIKNAIQNSNRAMVSYLAKHQLADGRNAYEAFTEDYAAKISRRLDLVDNLTDFDIEKIVDERMRE